LSRLIVALCAWNNRATSAADRPAASMLRISARCLSELRPSPAMAAALRAGRFEAGLGALPHHLPLIFRERAEHLHHHPPGGHGRVTAGLTAPGVRLGLGRDEGAATSPAVKSRMDRRPMASSAILRRSLFGTVESRSSFFNRAADGKRVCPLPASGE
jgi:hypothetical protein